MLLEKCDIPRQLAHGTFNAHTWRKYIEGEEISFSCENGYDPANQQAKAVCTKNGWSPAPRCDMKSKCGNMEQEELDAALSCCKQSYRKA